MATRVVKALVPTALAGNLLAQEFPSAIVDTDGTIFTVLIYGASYAEAIKRVRAWVSKSRIGPVLVTDDATAEELVSDGMAQTRRALKGESAPGTLEG